MLRRAAKSLLSRVASIASPAMEDAALPAFAIRVFTSSAPSFGIHVEEEVYNRQRNIINLGNRVVTLAPDSWVAPSAVLVGDVDLYEQVSIWHNCVLRGDLNSIKIGSFSNVGDRTVIHAAKTSPSGLPASTTVGRNVTIGQSCLLRSVIIQDECVIGDKSILLEGSLMEKNSVLAPGSVLPPSRRIPTGELWGGSPANFIRKLSKDEIAAIPELAAGFFPLSDQVSQEFLPHNFAYEEAEALRAVLKPDSGLVQGADLGSADTEVPEKP